MRGSPLSIGERISLIALYGFLCCEALTGPLRYYLSAVGLASLIYIPKAVLLCAATWSVVPGIVSGKGNASQLFTLLGVVFYVGVCVAYTGRVSQALFGLFSLVPLAAAFVCEGAVRKLRYSVVTFATTLWCLVALGVVLDFFLTLPWVGATYEVAGSEVAGAREWQTQGVERLAGFSRASFAAAAQLFCLGLFVVSLAKTTAVRSLTWLSSGALILLTTTKTTFAAYALLTLLLPIVSLPGPKLGLTTLVKVAVPPLLALICVALPLSIFFVDYRMTESSGTVALLLSSFEERLTWMWPDGFTLVEKHGNLLLGRGIGGFGAAQTYYEPSLYNSGDNLFVYLYGTCGLMALIIITVYAYRATTLNVSLPWDRTIWLLSVAAITIGWAISAVEEPFVATMFGLTYAYARLETTVAPRVWRPLKTRGTRMPG